MLEIKVIAYTLQHLGTSQWFLPVWLWLSCVKLVFERLLSEPRQKPERIAPGRPASLATRSTPEPDSLAWGLKRPKDQRNVSFSHILNG